MTAPDVPPSRPRPAHLRRLKLHHFRNLGLQELAFPPEGVAIIGDNAQGKSNLLEAIYYLEIFRSFRGARDDQLVAFGESVFRVAGAFDRPDGRADSMEIAAAYDRDGRRKKVVVDGAEPERLGDGIGRAAVVTFSPSDVAIVSEGPAERRRFLDIVLSLNHPGYLAALQRFRGALNQRNAALRANAPGAAVQAWDAGLIAAGAQVVRERRLWVERWRDAFAGHYAAIGGGQVATMTYAPSIALEAGAPEEDAFRAALADSVERERRMGTTVVGPHRDEIVFKVEEEAGGKVIRDFGSGGQRRTAALCLRLVEAATIREAREREPIILMDDVFAELDAGRSERVLELIDREETGQVILTAPKDADVRVRRGDLPRWRIAGGVVSEG